MKFNYQARTKKGKIKSGIVDASTKEAAFEVLKEKGLYVTAIEEYSPPIYAKKLKIFERVSRKDVVHFSRQLAIMFQSKVPLVESFRTLAKQTDNETFKEKILDIAQEIEGGVQLSKALGKYPKIFSKFYVSMVKSGEASGKLTEVFNYLADYLEREHHFHGKLVGALVYPAFILFVFVVVVTIIITFVIPQLASVLKQTEQELPWITQMVISASDFLRTRGWIVILVLIGLGFLIYRLVKTEAGKRFFDKYLIKLPLLGSFLKKLYLARLALNLSTLISGGLPIVQALDITGSVVGNNVFERVISHTRDEVRKGETMSSVLRRYPEVISPLFLQMIVVGEKTGGMENTLKNVVDFYQKDVDRGLDEFIKLIEPILIIVLGLVVGGLMAAVLMPIYSIGSF